MTLKSNSIEKSFKLFNFFYLKVLAFAQNRALIRKNRFFGLGAMIFQNSPYFDFKNFPLTMCIDHPKKKDLPYIATLLW